MSQEIFWLAATSLMTSVFWVPYVLNRMAVRGLTRTLANPQPDDAPLADWAERNIRAHRNAIENLVIFAPLALSVHVLGIGDSLTATACLVYFLARLVHFLVYTAGIPVLRTLSFAVGMAVQVALALRILEIL